MSRARKISIRATILVLVLVAGIAPLYAFELHRSHSDLGALLSDVFSERAKNTKQKKFQLVIFGKAIKPGDSPGDRELSMRTLWTNTNTSFPKASFISRSGFFLCNAFSSQIRAEVVLPNGAEATVLDEAELEHMTQIDYQKRFPYSAEAGFEHYEISQAGFNVSHTEAIIYINHYCGGLCGGGGYVLLQMSDGKWRVVEERRTWVS